MANERSFALLFSLIFLAFFGGFLREINSDGICYFSIAQKYAQGNLPDAVNGLWSPLISWLLAPFAYLGFDLQMAFKLLNGLFALTTGLCVLRLSKPFAFSPPWNHLLVLGLAVQLAYYALLITGPDLLSFCLASGLLVLIQSGTHRHNPLLTALLMSLMYLAKAYFLPLGLLFWLGVVAWERYALKRAWATYMYLVPLLFLLFSSPWMTALSLKYRQPTFSLAPAYNNWYVREGKQNKWIAEFLPPSNHTAFFAWEDIMQVYPLAQKPMDLKGKIGFQAKRSLRNLFSFCKRNLLHQPLGLLGFACMLWGWWLEKARFKHHVLGIFLLLYPLGYMAMFWEDRYLWIWVILNLLFSLHALRLGMGFLKPCLGTSLTLYLLAALAFCAPPLTNLLLQYGQDDVIFAEAQQLKPLISPHSRLLSYHPQPPLTGRKTWFYAYYLQAQDLGYLNMHMDSQRVYDLLDKHQANYLFVADSLSPPAWIGAGPKKFKEIDGFDTGYRIWEVGR